MIIRTRKWAWSIWPILAKLLGTKALTLIARTTIGRGSDLDTQPNSIWNWNCVSNPIRVFRGAISNGRSSRRSWQAAPDAETVFNYSQYRKGLAVPSLSKPCDRLAQMLPDG